MSRPWRPVAAARLPELLAERIVATTPPGTPVRVALDGPRCTDPLTLARSLVAPLRRRGREAAVIDAETFWRDASLRLEYGHEDIDSYRQWLDRDAVRREVLDPLGPGGSGEFLPSLRDPETNRSTRAVRRPAGPGGVVVVAGEFLLDGSLPFDLTIHLHQSPAARARNTASDQRWTLAAHDAYDRDDQPVARAAVVVKLDDPRHPALRDLPPG